MCFRIEKIGLFFILLLVAISCTSEKDKVVSSIYEINCDAETSLNVLGKEKLKGNGINFLSGANFISEDKARSGKRSLKLGGNAKYGFAHTFTDLKADMFVRASVWRNGEIGSIAFTSLEELKFQKYSKQVVETDSNGWEHIILEAFVPANYDGQEIKLFVMNQSDQISYFDDIEISVYESKPYPDYSDTQNMELIIDPLYIDEINSNRIKSFKRGVISKKTKKTYPAVVKYNGKELTAEVRIKGDWLDHIQGNKWSFRIKLLDGNFEGMKEFSIQQPGTRGFLNEYMTHQLFIEEDVLTPRYGFIPIKINGQNRGIYAFEEHFAKHLIESRNRREGPILKFDESGLWEINQKNLNRKSNFLNGPFVEAALISPFKKSKTKKNPTLFENFIIGQNLLNQFRYDSSPASDLFKIKSLASFYAILNMTGSWHALRWHNQRYYYDPVSSMLEIIAYDCFTEKVGDYRVALTPDIINKEKTFNYDQYMGYSPFNDPKFYQEYIKALDYYVNSNRIQDLFLKYEGEIIKYNEWITREYSSYVYEEDFILSGIALLRNDWSNVISRLQSNAPIAKLVVDNYNYDVDEPLDGMGVLVFYQGSKQLLARNFHSKDLYISAYSSKKLPEQGIIKLDKELKLEAYSNLSDMNDYMFECLFEPSKVYYKLHPDDSVLYDVKVISWPAPKLTSPRQELLNECDLSEFPFISAKDSILSIKKGSHTIDKALVIPKGWKVKIESGTSLNFINKAFFMSFSPLFATADENNKIRIYSSDNSAMGFTIIDAEERSLFKNVIFDGFNTLSYKGWNLTGAVSFYQSDVAIENTEFLNNVCEDGLNIIRSDFLLRNSMVMNAFADGFDADFATGLVEGCVFDKIGNDGIDFSGSEINIKNVSINNAGDKGVSGGESSSLYLENIDVENSNIGVASKDRSVVIVEGIKISNTYCAFAVYQKKTEYEPAQLHVKDAVLENIGRTDLLGSGSILNIDGNEMSGTENVNLDSLYNL